MIYLEILASGVIVSAFGILAYKIFVE